MTTEPSASASNCIVGLGGVFGDDRIGWCVIEQLCQLLPTEILAEIRLERVSTPADLLPRIENLERLILIDACQGLGIPGEIIRLTWPTSQVEHARHGFGHNITLTQALHIAAGLGKLPTVCELWCIEGRSFEFGQPLTPAVEGAAAQVAAEILQDLIRK